jgi:TolB-like protein/tetratricopeptide (TPR) repeat protein
MNSMWAELKRRKIVRVGIAYIVVAWLLLQVADVVLNNIESPAWVFRTILLLLVCGLPIAIIFAWAFEVTPDGIKKDESVGHSNSFGALALALVIALILAGAGFWFQTGRWDKEPHGSFEQDAQATRESNPVLAVLPFANMSSSSDNEYIADGMTEDVITLLAQSPGVEVIVRNSTFKYKGQNPDVRDVGRDLGADYVVEGSIRPLPKRIRVTVQVINANTGAHIWAEQYDRPISEFFDVQDEVSLGVAAAVGDAVFREEFNAANRSRTENLTAWMMTSRADVNFNLGILVSEADIALAREAIAVDPDYALAHATLARSLAIVSLAYGWPNTEALRPGATAFREEAEMEARLAVKMAPDDPKVLAFMAIALLWTGHPEEALSVAERVTKISPSYAEGIAYYADILIHNGSSRESIAHFDKAIRLTPNAPQVDFYHFLRGEALMHHGDFKAAEESLVRATRKSITANTNPMAALYLAGTRLRLGNVEGARLLVEVANQSFGLSIEDARRIMEFYTTDGGGDHFISIWQDLSRL